MRALAILASISMIVSLFLSWTGPALAGISISPWNLFRSLQPDVETFRSFVTASPIELVVFLATFILAALFLLLVLFNIPARLIGLIGGGAGVGLMGWILWNLNKGDQPLPVPVNIDLGKAADLNHAITQLAGYGAWAWAGGAALLLLASLVGWDRR
ncbi:hypothetical protein HOY34_16945 [Xinfangfangia sp. D13-10-4-6]|uniref:hypothetical protein n=1 Tax=Pseudogemmobacter hezensis TaxID=2737662 RepID=UPI001552C7F7|nr:hypothetical protein [Pseudogemmobacter hezensis]NPD16882.1 hypothetical protein [Pseudogemmobacter hezensis]